MCQAYSVCSPQQQKKVKYILRICVRWAKLLPSALGDLFLQIHAAGLTSVTWRGCVEAK